MVVFLVKSNKKTTQKGEHSCKCTEFYPYDEKREY